MFEKIATKIPGLFIIKFKRLGDLRGGFIKTFHSKSFQGMDLDFVLAEEYFSQSSKGVFRGMHFQTPPMDVVKLVFCASGSVNDYVLDIRVGSPTYGQYECISLDSNEPSAVYIPSGMAHGFHATSDLALMHYKADKVYDAPSDTGIDFRSLPFANELRDAITSDRDKTFVSFKDYQSPFVYQL